MDTWLEKVEGMEINNGFISPYFITDSVKMQVELEDAYVLVFNSKFYNPQEMLNLLKQIAEKNAPLLMLV
jgi:chaperonin GroEL